MNDLASIIKEAVASKASDIFFARDKVSFRIHGDVKPSNHSNETCLVEEILNAQPPEDAALAKGKLAGPNGDADFSIVVDSVRLRAHVYHFMGGLCAALRPLPDEVIKAELLGIDHALLDRLLIKKQGLVLITGPTGSGKSTTLNCMVDHINANRYANIVTIENPVEFVYRPKKSIIQQREIGKHVDSFAVAIRAAMRQNPDVIVVGEVRDYPTMNAMLQAAETGHLVFATLHTKRAFTTISRLIGMAPSEDQSEVRSTLSNALEMILCQRLLRRTDEAGRIACREILVANTAIRNQINDKKEKQIGQTLATSRAEGMIDWNGALKELRSQGAINAETEENERDNS